MAKLKTSFKDLLVKYAENIVYLFICSPLLHFYISVVMFRCIMYFDKNSSTYIWMDWINRIWDFFLIWIKILSLQNKHNLNHIPVVYTGNFKFFKKCLQCILFHERCNQSQRFKETIFLNYSILFFLNSLCLLLPPSFQCYQSSTDNSMPVTLTLKRLYL